MEMQIPGSVLEFLRKLVEGAGVEYAKGILVREEVSHFLWGELASLMKVKEALSALKEEGVTKEQVSKALKTLGEALVEANRELEGKSEVRHLTEPISNVLSQAFKEVFKEEATPEAAEALRKARLTFRKSILRRNIKWDIMHLLRKVVS